MDKWFIEAAATDHDLKRHILKIKGGMKDIACILKKFGAMCGRPVQCQDQEGFNYALYLHGATPAKLEKLTALLTTLAPQAQLNNPPEVIPPAAPISPRSQQSPAPQLRLEIPVVPLVAAVSAGQIDAPLMSTARMQLNSKQTFDSLLVGAYNRFAHAAATSVVGSPGSLYNPLLLHGAPGVGKTHLLNAIGAGLIRTLGADAVFFTNAPRLGRILEQSAADKELNKAKALLIDDMHLLAVTERNQTVLQTVFKRFFDKEQQIVMTSLYAPRALASLEEALKISLAKGWSVDMKVPIVQGQRDILQSLAERKPSDLTPADVQALQEKLAGSFSESARWLMRLAVFKRARIAAKLSTASVDLIRVLFEAGVSGFAEPSPADLEKAKGYKLPDTQLSAPGLIIIVPKGSEHLAAWIIENFYETGARHGFPQIYRHLAVESYAVDQPFGVPFQIGELCRRAGASKALILGPPESSRLAPREAEFAHAVRHILADSDIQMGWIAHMGLMVPAHYLNAQIDLAAAHS